MVARDIVRSISDGDSRPGEMLESEADMLTTFGVSRGTLREALRLLETQGLVRLKPGPRGGPVIGKPNPVYLGKTISLFLRMMGATYGELCECMLLVSPRMTELAARRCDKQEAQIALAGWLGDSEATSEYHDETEHETNFHSKVYQLSGNPILALVMNAIESLLQDHMLNTVSRDRKGIIAKRDSVRGPARATVHAEHQMIAESIVAKQPRKARALMEDHVQDIIEFLRTNLPAMMDRPVEWL